MISASQLAKMQQTATAALPDSGTILRGTSVSTGGLGGSTTFTPSGTVPCRVRPQGMISPSDIGRAGGQALLEYWLITMPAGTDIRDGDRISSLGHTFEAIGSGVTSWEIDRQVRAVEVT